MIHILAFNQKNKRMRNFIFIFACAIVCTNVYAYKERNYLQEKATIETIKKSLILNQEWVKYPSYSDREGWDDFLGEYKEEYIKSGEKYLDYQWQYIPASSYLEYERSGNRNIMQTPDNQNNNAIVSLLMAELAEGKGRFISKLIDGVFYTCEKTSWVISAHVLSQPGGSSLPNYKHNYIDLGAGRIGALMAWVYYFMHDEFDKTTPLVSERLRHELEVRILDSYEQSTYFWWLATHYKEGNMVNNWNPWCNQNVILCYFLLENDPDRLAAMVYKSMVSVDKFINYVKEDGACEEGPSYWPHAAGKLYDFLQVIYDGTGGKISIFDNPMIKNMGEYIANTYVGNGWVVNFADASAKGGGEASHVWRYGKAVGSQHMMNYASYLNSISPEGLPLDQDLYRSLETLKTRKEFKSQPNNFKSPEHVWYNETEFCYMSDQSGMFLAAKGGHNNESHNHNDVGSFNFYVDMTPIIIDAGVGTYTRQTFDGGRYSIWTMQSNYHNLPLINGYAQKPGTNFRAKNSNFDSSKMRFSTDISSAYPDSANVDSWQRSYTLKKGVLKIDDFFELTQAESSIQINFLTWGEVDFSKPGAITISVQGKKIELSYDSKTFTPSLETISLPDSRLSDVWGGQIYRISLNALTTKNKNQYTYSVKKLPA